MASKQIPINAVADTIREKLAFHYYDQEVKSAIEHLSFKIVLVGPPKVGKSTLINGLCGGHALAMTSSSLDSCTTKTKEYLLERYQAKVDGLPPIKIILFDTPGVESWENNQGEQRLIQFIEETNPICVIFCASPGSFASLASLRSLLKHCQQKSTLCATVCTNMWSNKNRAKVIQEFKQELKIFGDEEEKRFPNPPPGTSHVVTVFGKGALCTMVNSIEYTDEDLGVTKPEQGIDELIISIMELLDDDKALGWCATILDRRSIWEKVSQKVDGFLRMRFTELQSVQEKSPLEIGQDILVTAAKAYLNARV